MTSALQDQITAITQEVASLSFTAFSQENALQLGQILLRLAQEGGHCIALGVNLGDQVIFRAAVPGTTADYQHWIERKFQSVKRFSAASYALELKAQIEPDFAQSRALDAQHYVLCGGAVPLFIGSCMVGQVGCAGLPSVEDHKLVIQAIRTLHKEIDAASL